MKRLGLILTLFAVTPALAGRPPCCISLINRCQQPVEAAAVNSVPPCCCAGKAKPDKGVSKAPPAPPLESTCLQKHTHWAPVPERDDDTTPFAAVLTDIVPAVATPHTTAAVERTLAPPGARRALSLPLLL